MDRVRWEAVGALLLVFVIRCLLAMQADGTTVDEPDHLAYGERGLAAGTFLRENDGLNSKMPVSVLNALAARAARVGGPAADRTQDWPARRFAARLPSVALGALLGWCVWRWASLLFGGPAGILALGLYTFCPNILAHTHLVTTDIATALGMFAAVFCLWRYLESPSRGRLALAAGVFGAAQLTKATALFLWPIVALILLDRLVRDALRQARGRSNGAIGSGGSGGTSGSDGSGGSGGSSGSDGSSGSGAGGGPGEGRLSMAAWLLRRLVRDALVLAACGLGAIAALNLGFRFEGSGTPLAAYTFVSPGFQRLAALPGLRALPVPLPYAYLQGVDMVSRDSWAGVWSYLRGRYSETGFRSYFFWAFLVKVPLATQVILGLAVCLLCSGRARAPGGEAALLVPLAVLLAYLSFLLQLDIGFRYCLPALPFLFVFGSRVAAPQVWANPAWRPLLAGALAALMLWLGVASLRFHPHYLAYFNEIAGGPDGGGRWLIDSNLDWGQDVERVRARYDLRGPRPAFFDPSGPLAGRIAVGVSSLVGRDPEAARRHAWLRDGGFRPVAEFGHSVRIFEVSEADLRRCCAALQRAATLPDLAADLALSGEPFGGAEGTGARLFERLNDGMLGASQPVDPARTQPPLPHPVRAWFGIRWPQPQTLSRIVAFPGFAVSGPRSQSFLALDYVLQSLDGNTWRDIPGTRVRDNSQLRVEHRFAPLRTTAVRIFIERERNSAGAAEPTGAFRAGCLEIAAYER